MKVANIFIRTEKGVGNEWKNKKNPIPKAFIWKKFTALNGVASKTQSTIPGGIQITSGVHRRWKELIWETCKCTQCNVWWFMTRASPIACCTLGWEHIKMRGPIRG